MFTDIVGYTALMQNSEEKTIKLRDSHRNIFNPITNNHNGQIIQYYGDGTLSIFESAVEAVNCGIELQNQFIRSDIPVRIGIHIGEIIITDNDIVGDAVNLASRVESIAIPGSVFITEKVQLEIFNKTTLKLFL
jgi:class 3 adenylate cyclase